LKKLIVITSPLYIRNYVDSDAFAKVKDKDTFIVCTRNITNKKSVIGSSNFAGEFEASKVKKDLFYFISLLLMYSNRKLNKGFYFYFKTRNPTIYYPSIRLKNKVFELIKIRFLQFFIINILEFFRPFFQPIALLRFCLIIVINFLGLTGIVVKIYNSFLPPNRELKSIIESVNPDLVLVPNGGMDANGHEVLALSAKLNFKTMLLIDNWDNLCSKSRFPIEPDYLSVWGEQAKTHAINLHKFESSRIFLAGTPRFDGYLNYKNTKSSLEGKYKEVINFPYILFAGCWPDWDEIGTLKILNELVEKHKNLLPKNCKILYRPHPWGNNSDRLDTLISKNLKNIAIDPQISNMIRPKDYTKRTDFQPDLDYYPILLDKSEFVICPMSTIVLEASVMNKKVLGLIYDDGKSFSTPSFMYENSDYFDRLLYLKNVKLLDDIENLDDLFYQIITTDMHVDKKALGYYIVDDGLLYNERINRICNKLL